MFFFCRILNLTSKFSSKIGVKIGLTKLCENLIEIENFITLVHAQCTAYWSKARFIGKRSRKPYRPARYASRTLASALVKYFEIRHILRSLEGFI